MNKLQMRGHWHQWRGRWRERWARWRGDPRRLADAQVERIRGRLQQQHARRPRTMASSWEGKS